MNQLIENTAIQPVDFKSQFKKQFWTIVADLLKSGIPDDQQNVLDPLYELIETGAISKESFTDFILNDCRISNNGTPIVLKKMNFGSKEIEISYQSLNLLGIYVGLMDRDLMKFTFSHLFDEKKFIENVNWGTIYCPSGSVGGYSMHEFPFPLLYQKIGWNKKLLIEESPFQNLIHNGSNAMILGHGNYDNKSRSYILNSIFYLFNISVFSKNLNFDLIDRYFKYLPVLARLDVFLDEDTVNEWIFLLDKVVDILGRNLHKNEIKSILGGFHYVVCSLISRNKEEKIKSIGCEEDNTFYGKLTPEMEMKLKLLQQKLECMYGLILTKDVEKLKNQKTEKERLFKSKLAEIEGQLKLVMSQLAQKDGEIRILKAIIGGFCLLAVVMGLSWARVDLLQMYRNFIMGVLNWLNRNFQFKY